jgi:CBS domain containing-hemolysin-like protein
MTLWLLLALVVALAATSYLAALHLALVSASRTALERRLEDAGTLSRRAWVLDRLDDSAHAVSLFRTTGRVACFSIILVLIAGFGEEARITWSTLGVTIVVSVLLVWFCSGAISTAVARHLSHGLVEASIPVVRVALVLAAPFLAVVALVDEAVRRLAGADGAATEAEDELLLSIEDSKNEGDLDPLSASILENVVEFRSTEVSSVMTPRTNIIGLQHTDDLARIRSFLADAGHSRIPVYDGSLDHIVGILLVKDLVRYVGTEAIEFRLRPLLRQPIRVPETKPVRDLLLDFQRSELHMAIVIDEYGGTAGLATIEDVLEEIVGEINDEHDVSEETAPELKPLGEGRWEVPGRYRVVDLNAALELAIPDGADYDTVAGYLLKRFGRIPRVGDRIDDEGWTFEVSAATPSQILAVTAVAPGEGARASGGTGRPSDVASGVEAAEAGGV